MDVDRAIVGTTELTLDWDPDVRLAEICYVSRFFRAALVLHIWGFYVFSTSRVSVFFDTCNGSFRRNVKLSYRKLFDKRAEWDTVNVKEPQPPEPVEPVPEAAPEEKPPDENADVRSKSI